ncbi:hydantoinase/oxoprolinase family protein [Streptomyces sp. NPDC090088]|uniref:hydantoinase/oxoprolinase family protein n=1 Tax=Streptomyces sp. NPDC090088 TaxID=3365944 RepID=UPI0037FD2048
MSTRAAVDIGGTFTDVVVYDDERGSTVIGKTLSTPHDLIEGILAGFTACGTDVANAAMVVHGSTVVINALTERKGAHVALVTTEGFRDVYEIGRVNRPEAFDLGFRQHRPLLPRQRVFEVPERMRADGRVHRPLDEDAARRVAERVRRSGADAIAVCLLHGYRNPEHERRLGEILAEHCPDAYITLSHQLTREYREFERTSTTVANAYVGPVVSDYLTRLSQRLTDAGAPGPLLIMQSGGGLSDVETVREQCVHMMESGPAGGVVGTIEVCRTLGLRDAIAFDMGGTTAKASVIRDLTFPQAAEYFVGGYAEGLPIQIPCLDIVEVGTGGGSTAWIDSAGGLHVGPRSAGAFPGPACYGQGGTEATVTDAAVALGLLPRNGTLSGGLRLDGAAAQAAVARVGDEVGLDTARTASGILAIAAASMANAVRAVTTERGLDPREFALFAYGGNGPLHISLVARELGITQVVVPQIPSVFSALGMLMADLRHDAVRTQVNRLDDIDSATLDSRFRELEQECLAAVDDPEDGGLLFLRQADMRYVGQEHSLTLEVPPLDTTDGLAALKTAFDLAHQQRFAHGAPEEPAEIVTLRVSLIRSVSRPEPAKIGTGDLEPPAAARAGTRPMILRPDAPVRDCPVFSRAHLLAGNVITGPAAIAEDTTTTLLREGDRCEVDAYGNLLLTIGGTR